MNERKREEGRGGGPGEDDGGFLKDSKGGDEMYAPQSSFQHSLVVMQICMRLYSRGGYSEVLCRARLPASLDVNANDRRHDGMRSNGAARTRACIQRCIDVLLPKKACQMLE